MFQAPKRFSKPPEGTVGAAPLSCPLELAAVRSGSASCFDEEGLVADAFAVLVSADEGADLGRDALAALCPVFAAEAAGFDLDADASAGCVARESSALEPNRLLKKLPTPPELPGTAEATCTDERGPLAGFDSAEARLSVLALIVSVGGSNPGGLTWGGIVPAAV